jgi:hypothetical protein
VHTVNFSVFHFLHEYGMSEWKQRESRDFSMEKYNNFNIANIYKSGKSRRTYTEYSYRRRWEDNRFSRVECRETELASASRGWAVELCYINSSVHTPLNPFTYESFKSPNKKKIIQFKHFLKLFLKIFCKKMPFIRDIVPLHKWVRCSHKNWIYAMWYPTKAQSSK